MCTGCHQRLSGGFHEIKQLNESEAHDDEVLRELRAVEGNDVCVDCGDPDATWVSISLGTLMCLKVRTVDDYGSLGRNPSCVGY